MRCLTLAVLLCFSTMTAFAGQGPRAQSPDSLYAEGLRFSTLGVFSLAQERLFSSLSKFEELGDCKGAGKCLVTIGLTYFRLKNYEQSKDFYDKALLAAQTCEQPKLEAAAYNGLGMVLNVQGKDEESLRHYQASLRIKTEMRDTVAIAVTLNNLGTLERERNRPEAALEYYRSSIQLKQQIGDHASLALTYMNIGDIYGVMGRFDSTEKYLWLGLSHAEKEPRLPMLADFYYNFAALGEVYGRTDSIVKYQRLYIAARDSLYQEGITQAIAKQQILHEAERQNDRMEINRKRIALLERDQDIQFRRQVFLVVVVGALLLIIVLLYFIIRLRTRANRQERAMFAHEKALKDLALKEEAQQKRLLEMEVENQNRELLTSAMFIQQRNEILFRIKEEVDEMGEGGMNKAQVLRRTGRLLLDSINFDSDWEGMKLHFEKVHPAFFKKIKSEFPSLSETDLRHCAYIRMGMSTKEISRLMNIQPTSVQKSRGRIKKKLGLGLDADLMDFIRGF